MSFQGVYGDHATADQIARSRAVDAGATSFSHARLRCPVDFDRHILMRPAAAALLFVLLAAASSAQASSLALTGDMRWIVLASRSTEDEAIALARMYSRQLPAIRVVRAVNGWYAVVAGPERVTNARAHKNRLLQTGNLPKDLLFTRGDNYVSEVWVNRPVKPDLEVTYDGKGIATGRLGDLSISIGSRTTKDGDHVPVLTLARSGRIIARTELDESSGTYPNGTATVVRLDPSSREPQVVFSSHWGGAHCCTMTKVLTNVGGIWRAVEGRTLDGEGYRIDDVDQDGYLELVSVDNSFLYAFASYADSTAPVRISRLNDGRIDDVTAEPRYQPYLRQHVAQLEHWANTDPTVWRKNGFLGGWVASMAQIGRFDEAWSRMLPLHDRRSDWTMTECTVAKVENQCPQGRERSLTFPVALRKHLEEHGYAPRHPVTATWAGPARTPSSPEPKPAPRRDGGSSGTGFFVSRDGHVVTNAHVVSACSSLSVRSPAGTALPARLVARDEMNDLALLATDQPAAKIATIRTAIRLGEPVAAFGFPLSQVLSTSGNFTLGNVTALAGIADDTRFLQISAPVQPGNSGGPLVDENGNVVGVVTGKLNAIRTVAAVGDIPQNVNFAIKASGLASFLESRRVTLADAARTVRLSAPDLAEEAAAISVHVRCE